MTQAREGGCQCGAVRYRLDAKPIALAVCHCADCQCSSGSAFGMSLIVPEDGFHVVTGSPQKYSKTADSGRIVDCFFCSVCGVRVFHKATYMAGTINLKPGSLDDRSWLEPSLHVWTDSKQPWVPIPTGVKTAKGQPM